MNRKQFRQAGPQTEEIKLTDAQEAFKNLLKERKGELRNRYFDFKSLKVTITGAGDRTIRLSYNVNGLSAKGVTNCNFYLDWDDASLEILEPQVHEALNIGDEEAPSISLEELMG